MWATVTDVGTNTIELTMVNKTVKIDRKDLTVKTSNLKAGDHVILSGENDKVVNKNELLTKLSEDSSNLTQLTTEIESLLENTEDNEVELLLDVLLSDSFDVAVFDSHIDLLRALFESPKTNVTNLKGKKVDMGAKLMASYLSTYHDNDERPNISVEYTINSVIRSIKNGSTDKSHIGTIFDSLGKSYRKKYPFRVDYDEELLHHDTKVAAIVENGFGHQNIGNVECAWGDIIVRHPSEFPKTIDALVNAVGTSPHGMVIAELLATVYEEEPTEVSHSDILESVKALADDYTIKQEKLQSVLAKLDAEDEVLRSKNSVKKNVEYLQKSSPGDTDLNLEKSYTGPMKNDVDEVFMRLATLADDYPVVVGAQIGGLLSYHNETPQPFYMSEIMQKYAQHKPKDVSKYTDTIVDIMEQAIDDEVPPISFSKCVNTLRLIAEADASAIEPYVETLYNMGNGLESRNANINDGYWPKSGCHPYKELEKVIMLVHEESPNVVEQVVGTPLKQPIFDDDVETRTQPNSGIITSVKSRFTN